MRQWMIPDTDLFISSIVMGTGNFSVETEADAMRRIDHFADCDGNLLDTANSYGKLRTSDPNSAEQIIGRWLKQSSQGSSMMISTKGGFPPFEDLTNSRLTVDDVTADLELSLQTLGRDTIDIYYLHRDDPSIPVADLLGMLRDFRQQGKIRYYGLSNWSTDRVAEAIALEKKQVDKALLAIQNRWSLVRYNDRAAIDPTVVAMDWPAWELFKKENMAVMPYSSLGKGYFSKYLQNTCSMTEKLRRYYENDLNKHRADALKQLHKETGYSISQLVLAWLLQQPMPVFPVVGFSKNEQLRDAVEAAGMNLSFSQIEMLNAGETW
ncbi:MAG: aldo/keto reductase [Eubacteriales bacterium]|nr:aldo/keto reductase [Eubacteriales bacterium]